MQIDTLSYDSLKSRPLPEWLVDQKMGVASIKAEEIVMKEDRSLEIAMFVTVSIILLVVVFLTLRINRKHKKQAS